MHKKGELIEVDITDAADRNLWFGQTAEGIALFVGGPAAPGDRVVAQITKRKRRFLEAKLIEVIRSSPDRVEPVCTHFGTCGGCKWQHIGYEQQLQLKRKRVDDALRHIGTFTDTIVRDTIGAEKRTHYRNKIEFSFSNRRYLLDDERESDPSELAKPGNFALGFHAAKMYSKVIDIDYCHIATPEMNTALQVTKQFCLSGNIEPFSTHSHDGYLRHLVIRQSFHDNRLLVNFVTSSFEEAIAVELGEKLKEALGDTLATLVNNVTTRKSEFSAGEQEHVVFGDGFIMEQIADLRFRISANSFFQTNSLMAVRLFALVREMAALKPTDIVYDLYCGTGSLTILLAPDCRHVYGCEMSADAVEDARQNLTLNGVNNCHFEQVDLCNSEESQRLFASFGHPDVVVIDPPRAGLHPKTVAELVKLKPQRIVYVSCNPASLARDCNILCQGAGYELGDVQPIDMFPYTNHIESVTVLSQSH